MRQDHVTAEGDQIPPSDTPRAFESRSHRACRGSGRFPQDCRDTKQHGPQRGEERYIYDGLLQQCNRAEIEGVRSASRQRTPMFTRGRFCGVLTEARLRNKQLEVRTLERAQDSLVVQLRLASGDTSGVSPVSEDIAVRMIEQLKSGMSMEDILRQ